MAPRSRNNRSGGSKDKKTVTIKTEPFRIGFENILSPEETDNGDRYNITMLFPPGSPSIKAIDDAMADCMDDYFGDDWPSGKKDILPEDKFYDAGTKDYPGFKKGWMVLKASSTDAPGVIDADKNEVMSKREVYRGRWARAVIAVTTFDNKAKGITAYLNHVQLLDHDEAFSGRGSAEDSFDKYEMQDRTGGRRGRNERDEDDEDDRDTRRGRGRDREDDRDEDRGSGRGRGGRDRDDEERGSGRSARDRSRSDEDDRDEGRSRGRGRGRDRDEDAEEGKRGESSRGRSGRREEPEEDEERPSRGRGRSRDDDDSERGSSRSGRSSRGDDDDKRSGDRGRSSGRSSRDDDDWN